MRALVSRRWAIREKAIYVALEALRTVASTQAAVGHFEYSSEQCLEAIEILTPRKKGVKRKK